jgi:hypothetical protein
MKASLQIKQVAGGGGVRTQQVVPGLHVATAQVTGTVRFFGSPQGSPSASPTLFRVKAKK